LVIDEIIEPPIQTLYFLSGEASILGFIVEGASALISFYNLSFILSNIVLPPANTILLYKSFLISVSHLIIESNASL